jgi:hypothetical protein
MKSLPIMMTLVCLVFRAQADERTWLNSEDPGNGSYLAPALRFSYLNEEVALWPGARLGWIFGSTITAGLEGYMLAGEPGADNPPGAIFNMAVGGVSFEAIPFPERRTHLVFSLLLGAGGSQAGGAADIDSLASHGFAVIEPGAGLEFNLTRNVIIGPGIRYLWISGNVPGMDSKWKVSETALSLILKFVDFDDY